MTKENKSNKKDKPEIYESVRENAKRKQARSYSDDSFHKMDVDQGRKTNKA